MYYIFIKEIDENLAEITGFVREDLKDDFAPSKIAKAIQMENRPDEPEKEGQYSQAFLNKDTMEYEYKFFPIPELEETQIAKLEKEVKEYKKELSAIQAVVDELLLANMPDDLDI